MNKFLPTLPAISRETLTLLAATLIAAYIISRVPAVRNFVSGASITVKDSTGTTLF